MAEHSYDDRDPLDPSGLHFETSEEEERWLTEGTSSSSGADYTGHESGDVELTGSLGMNIDDSELELDDSDLELHMDDAEIMSSDRFLGIEAEDLNLDDEDLDLEIHDLDDTFDSGLELDDSGLDLGEETQLDPFELVTCKEPDLSSDTYLSDNPILTEDVDSLSIPDANLLYAWGALLKGDFTKCHIDDVKDLVSILTQTEAFRSSQVRQSNFSASLTRALQHEVELHNGNLNEAEKRLAKTVSRARTGLTHILDRLEQELENLHTKESLEDRLREICTAERKIISPRVGSGFFSEEKALRNVDPDNIKGERHCSDMIESILDCYKFSNPNTKSDLKCSLERSRWGVDHVPESVKELVQFRAVHQRGDQDAADVREYLRAARKDCQDQYLLELNAEAILEHLNAGTLTSVADNELLQVKPDMFSVDTPALLTEYKESEQQKQDRADRVVELNKIYDKAAELFEGIEPALKQVEIEISYQIELKRAEQYLYEFRRDFRNDGASVMLYRMGRNRGLYGADSSFSAIKNAYQQTVSDTVKTEIIEMLTEWAGNCGFFRRNILQRTEYATARELMYELVETEVEEYRRLKDDSLKSKINQRFQHCRRFLTEGQRDHFSKELKVWM